MFSSTATLRHITRLPPPITFDEAILRLHNHELLIKFDPEYTSHEELAADPANPDAKRYKVTDNLKALPAGLWNTQITFEAELTDTKDGVNWVIKAPLGLVQKTSWRCVKVDGMEGASEVEGEGEWCLVEDVEITANRMLVTHVKGKCEDNWRGTHGKFLESLKA
ncbi:hypothetical protein CFE70_002448 [Pyrenophora teres f. teres 0-1]|uniref:DUF7053 domain-containing protein n=1 Tax=Pyrenophora teres f. teres (strain 0-1) TaxID=861557 RepID=E3RTS4_PYRTT|nr:hypothetical protein PTT_12428 [Pyrenophora teres f. teres 0-1]KAE8843008.1 hypothetical protein HRS9139_02305 [Pyrenophora teres f. teres]CAA9958929.1 hypothetical protein PTMSG1_02461 [Pyrenophora teres f. maculata]KAE8849936.1 hypothetical protein PTNB85_00352 [Pyrenophora teres f. teres]KAE8852040.1 hypothetical protein HRS9122_02327 [Pyrenophora teres f. teres]